MVGDGSVADEPAPEQDLPLTSAQPLRRRRVRKKRKQSKYPRPARLALWLGLPALLWSAVYLVVRWLF